MQTAEDLIKIKNENEIIMSAITQRAKE